MSGLFISAYVFFGIIMIIGIIYLYTLYVYTKGTKFTKTHYSWMGFTLYALVFIILIVMGILFCTSFKEKLENENWIIHTSLCFSFAFITIIDALAYILIIHFHNKSKISYDQIDKTDFKPFLEKVKQKIGNVESFKLQLEKKHKKYYDSVNFSYKNLLIRAKNENFSRSEKLADIVLFNDMFSHKWCGFMNNYQLLLVYEFLTII